MKPKTIKETETVFEKGDVIATIMKKEIRLIMGVSEGRYEFMNLKEQRFQDVSAKWYVIEKGSISNQPIDLVHKYFSIIEL